MTSDVARDLCERAAAKAYIAGAIGSLGSQYVVGLNAVNCKTGDPLVQEQATADRSNMFSECWVKWRPDFARSSAIP